MSTWQGKAVLVTGGSAGLGRAIAAAFAARGAKLALCARDADRLHSAALGLGRSGADVFAVPADVTRQEEVDQLVARTVESFGRLDVLVNCVGRSSRGKAIDVTPDDFRDLLELNFLAAVRTTRAAIPHLAATKGHIVNIGSLAAKSASRFLGAYPASKFPLAAYSQQLRLELKPEGIHVLLVCPGPIAREDSGTRYAEQAADLPESARQPGGGVKVKLIDPDDLARRIVRACERRQPELIVPGKAKWLFALAQLWPSLADRILLR
jgi:NAD(P)-dependent dehydrogenase (short-subunit alcohol dehydrogenase family)